MSPARRPNMGLLNGREQLPLRWSSFNAVRRHVIEFFLICVSFQWFSVNVRSHSKHKMLLYNEHDRTWSISQHHFRDIGLFLPSQNSFLFHFFLVHFSTKHKTCLLLCCSMRPLNRKRDSNDLALALAFHFISFSFSLHLMASHQPSEMRTIFMSKPETFKCAMLDVGTGKRANQCSVSFLT